MDTENAPASTPPEPADRPRGKRTLEVFICHGCQSCWTMDDQGQTKEHYPHYLSPMKDVTDQVNRLKGIRKLMGYVQDASDTVVILFQDDATRSYIVKVGLKSYVADSFEAALDEAIADNPEND